MEKPGVLRPHGRIELDSNVDFSLGVIGERFPSKVRVKFKIELSKSVIDRLVFCFHAGSDSASSRSPRSSPF